MERVEFMRQRISRGELRGTSATSAAGWLFADLLLVLAMLFLAANTMGLHPPPPPSPPTHITPPPKQRVLEHTYCQIVLNDGDPNTFSNDLSFAKQTLDPQINSVSLLRGRQVGLAIAYGGVDDSNNAADRSLGTSMAAQTYRVLKDRAKNKDDEFHVASYFDSLFTGNFPASNVIIDVYLIVRSDSAADTCDPERHQQV